RGHRRRDGLRPGHGQGDRPPGIAVAQAAALVDAPRAAAATTPLRRTVLAGLQCFAVNCEEAPMYRLRPDLTAARTEYRQIRYDGDLAGELLPRRAPARWWLLPLATSAIAAMTLIAL